MKALRLISFLLLAVSAFATERVTVTVTVTNPAVIGDTFTINASTRTFATNASTSTIQTNATIGGTATNLYTHLLLNPPSGPTFVIQTGTNEIKISGSVGQAMTASLLTNWGTISYATQTVSLAMGVRVPISSEPTATNRTFIGSELVAGIEAYSTQQFSGTTIALTNFLGKTNSGQTISGSNTFTGANVFSNSTQSIVGGTASNVVVLGGNITNNGANVFRGTNTFGTLIATNLTVVSNITAGSLIVTNGAQLYVSNSTQVAIGSGVNVQNATNVVAIGRDAIANQLNAIAIGFDSEAGASGAIAIGRASYVGFDSGVSIGNTADASNTNSIAIGGGANSSGGNSIAFGILANAQHYNSIVVGNNSTSTDTNQVLLGANGVVLSVPGIAAFSNSIAIGTAERYATPTGFTKGIQFQNGAVATADPTNAAVINSVSGSIRYRTSGSNEGSGANNYLHNRGAEVVGSGTDYSLTTSYALVDFGGTDPDINTLPTAGTYFITAVVAVNVGANSGDDFAFKFYDATAAADIANSEVQFDGTGHGGITSVNVHTVATFASASRIQLYGKNATAARGSVTSTLTKLIYVRLY